MFKKIISSVLMVVMVISSTLVFSSCQTESKNPERPDDIPGLGSSESDLYNEEYRLVSENDKFAFYFNDYTTDIKVVNKKTGYTWNTEIDNGGEIVRGNVFKLRYTDNTGADLERYSSESIEDGMFVIGDIDNGVMVRYGAGFANFVINFPIALSESRLQELGERMGDPFILMEYYELKDFTTEESLKNYKEEEIESYKNSYGLAFEEPWYYMPSDNYKNYKQVMELNDLFSYIDYTAEELAADNEGVNVPSNDSIEEFAFSVYYTLTETGLNVRIPEQEIYCNEDYPLQSISVLPGLMDFNNKTDGYFLLPDGSGSIMNFNNDKGNIRYSSVYVQMYGVDNSRVIEEKTSYYNNAIFPVFGTTVKTKKGNEGIFGIIKSGDTFAGISADNYNEENSKTNNLTLEFRVNERVSMDSFSYSGSDSESKYQKYQFQRYLGDISVDFNLLDGDDATYSGMAKFYSDYLFGADTATTEAQDYYSTVEVIGTINATKKFFGIDYNSKQVLTDFNQVSKIASELKNNGFNNLNIKLSGWCNGGYEHGWLDGIDIDSNIGGEDGFTELYKSLEEKGIGLYPDIDFQNVYTSESTPSSKYRAATLNGGDSIISEYSPIDFEKDDTLAKYVLNMNGILKNFNGFMSDYKDYGIKNISYRYLGTEISSNFKDDETFMERQETLNNLVSLVSGAKDDGYSIMGNGGQAPYLQYLDVVNELPIESSDFDKSDYSVPFTAMVLSGHLDYTYQPINLSNNNQKDLLKLIEAGSGAYFKIFSEKYEGLANSSYSSLYSAVYSDIKDQMIEQYSYVAEALDGVYGTAIKSHEQITDGVFKTTYENGTSIYVNYNNKDYKGNGILVPAQGYHKENVKGGE